MVSPPISDAIDYLWQKLHEMEPSTQLGGIFADKPGYHNTRSGNKPTDYSVVDAPDKGGPSNLAAALDWTFPEAQHGDYTRIAKYAKRLLDSGKDMNDDRLNWMREFYGQADKDSAVEGWDYRYVTAVSSDSSHLWHIHFSFSRNALTRENMDKLLDVLGYEMALSADQTRDAVWNRDNAVNNDGFYWRTDSPKHDPAGNNPEIMGETAITEAAQRAHLAYQTALNVQEQVHTIDADMQFVQGKLDQILAILQAGIPVPGEVNLTEESIGKVADAVVDEEQARLVE
jgi:hypothetical protein